MAETHESHAHPNYLAIFGYLVVLTGASFATLALHGRLGPTVIVLFVLCVAVCKASLVAMYFMHLKSEKAWKFVLLVPTLFMATVLVLALLPDIARLGQ